MGYNRAGFDEIVGVDNKPQLKYPFEFVQADALEYLAEHGKEFDAIHASPPCQLFTALKTMWNAREHPDLLSPTQKALAVLGKPHVIENVPGSPMVKPILLCGSMFGLGTGIAELRRHRLFEVHPRFVPSWGDPNRCRHGIRAEAVIGVYGGHGRDRRCTVGVYGDGNGRDYRKHPATVGVYGNTGGSSVRDGAQRFSTEERREAMGIDWMTGNELSQAIPPAYTEFIGKELLREIKT